MLKWVKRSDQNFSYWCACIIIHTHTREGTETHRHRHPLQILSYWLQWEQHFICVKVNWWQTRNKLYFLALWLSCQCQYISLGNACDTASHWVLWNMAESILNQPSRQIFPLSTTWQNFKNQITLYFLPNRYNNLFLSHPTPYHERYCTC